MFKQNNSANFETESIKSSLWRYFHTFILVTGGITVTADNNKNDGFTNCALLSTCDPELNYLFKSISATKFETECFKTSVWIYFDTVILVTGDEKVTAVNTTNVAFRNYAPFSPSKTTINDFFKENKSGKIETECIKSSLWDHFAAFILIAGDITVIVHNKHRCCIYKLRIIKTQINDLFKQNNSANFEIESIKSSLWRYFYAFTLVTEDITVIEYNNRDNAFINCAQLSISKTEINDFFNEKNSTKFEI